MKNGKWTGHTEVYAGTTNDDGEVMVYNCGSTEFIKEAGATATTHVFSEYSCLRPIPPEEVQKIDG